MLRTLLTLLCLASVLPPSWAGERSLPDMIEIPAGPFVSGSNRVERDYAYTLDEAAYGSPLTREQQWYEREHPRGITETKAYAIMSAPVINAQYASFVRATGHRVPDVDRHTWERYGLRHAYAETHRFAWHNGKPPPGREQHPVVLVSVTDAGAYAQWLSKVTGHHWRLPTEEEWEKAARGTDGRYFPWGNEYDSTRLNSADRGPFDTMPVSSFASGTSPFGLRDAAGQVFEWTASTDDNGLAVVKGGSWDDKGCGVCRPAARHARPPGLKHILIGFRLIRE